MSITNTNIVINNADVGASEDQTLNELNDVFLDAEEGSTHPNLTIHTSFTDDDNDILFEKFVVEDKVDSNGDEKQEPVPRFFLAPKKGEFLYQEVTIDNSGDSTVATNVEVLIEATNPFVEFIGIDYTGDGKIDPSNDEFTITQTVDENNNQAFLVEISEIRPHETVAFQAVSQVTARGDESLSALDFGFTIEDGSQRLESQDSLLYLSKTGFSQAPDGTSNKLFEFAPVEDYIITFDLGNDHHIDTELAAQPVRAAGTLVDTQTHDEIEYVLEDFEINIDPRGGGSYRNMNDGLITEAELNLVWANVPSQVNGELFQNLANGTSFDPFQDLVHLLEDGLLAEGRSKESTVRDGDGFLVGQSFNPDGSPNGDVDFGAFSGNVIDSDNPPSSNILVFDYPLSPPNDKLPLEDVLNRFDAFVPNWEEFNEIVIDFSRLGDNSVQLENFDSDLPWFSRITQFSLPEGIDKLPINNVGSPKHLDLSNISVFDFDFAPAGMSIEGTNKKDRVTGSRGDDEIRGNHGNDVLNGSFGDDVLLGGNGRDTLRGEMGDDQLTGGDQDDVLAGGSGSNTLTGGAGNDIFEITAGESATITDFGGVGRGSRPSKSTLRKADTIKFASEGLTADTLQFVQVGDDLKLTFLGDDTGTHVILKNIELENVDNLLKATGANVNFDNIEFVDDALNDSIDVFNAGSDRNRIWNRNSVTFLNDRDNRVIGFSRSDDVINGQGGNDILKGLSGDDILRGGEGDDLLQGGHGDDILRGGLGDDRVFGGHGRDTFVLAEGDGTDIIQDFKQGTDLIGLANGLSFGQLSFQGHQIRFGNEVLAILPGIKTAHLGEDSFIEI